MYFHYPCHYVWAEYPKPEPEKSESEPEKPELEKSEL